VYHPDARESDAIVALRSRDVDAIAERPEERDAAWTDVVLVRCPPFGRYETKTTRKMPLALLTPSS